MHCAFVLPDHEQICCGVQEHVRDADGGDSVVPWSHVSVVTLPASKPVKKFDGGDHSPPLIGYILPGIGHLPGGGGGASVHVAPSPEPDHWPLLHCKTAEGGLST